MGQEKTLAEVGAFVVGGEQVADLAETGDGVEGEVDHGGGLGSLVDCTGHHLHHGDDVEDFLDLRVDLGSLALEVLDLVLILQEHAFLDTTDEVHVHSTGRRSSEKSDGESFHL